MIHLSTKLLLVGAVALALAEAYPNVSPSSHDFGNVGVMGLKETDFRVTHSPDTPVGTTLTYGFEGPDKDDFHASGVPCPSGTGGGPVCTVSVEFRPRKTGRRSAKLVVTDSRGNAALAPVEGTGVLPLCTHTVIPCNYAIHYSGVFSWQGGGEQVNVDVVRGVASCNGTAPEGGGSRVLDSSGWSSGRPGSPRSTGSPWPAPARPFPGEMAIRRLHPSRLNWAMANRAPTRCFWR